jgi:hypothetical protein
MNRGFMDLAVEIIKEYPGITSREVAREAVDSTSISSGAKNPEQSFATTLNKQVQAYGDISLRQHRLHQALVKKLLRNFL